MKSIDRLRQFLEDQFGSERFAIHSYGYVQGMAIANIIEKEIAERYMELPVDADGEPIHLGDELDNINKSERYKVTSIGDNGYIRIYSDTGWIHSSHCRHVKPRMLEDVLYEFGIVAARELNADPDGYGISDKTIAKCASEIHDLLSREGSGDDF